MAKSNEAFFDKAYNEAKIVESEAEAVAQSKILQNRRNAIYLSK
jgi:hypothetical protein